MDSVNKFLSTMPFDRRYKVTEQQTELIKKWMQDKPFDGGINFSADWKEIYRVDVSMLK